MIYHDLPNYFRWIDGDFPEAIVDFDIHRDRRSSALACSASAAACSASSEAGFSQAITVKLPSALHLQRGSCSSNGFHPWFHEISWDFMRFHEISWDMCSFFDWNVISIPCPNDFFFCSFRQPFRFILDFGSPQEDAENPTSFPTFRHLFGGCYSMIFC